VFGQHTARQGWFADVGIDDAVELAEEILALIKSSV